MPKKKAARNNPGVKDQQNEKPQTQMEVFLGKTLMKNANGDTDSTAKLLSKKKRLVALYFAAKDDKECQEFTPKLIDFYKAVSDDEIEVVFVSSDKSAADFNSYYSQMPWLSMLASDEVIANKNSLANSLAITTTPSLTVLDVATGKLVTREGVPQIRDAEKTTYKELLAKWKATEPVDIKQGVKSALAKDLTIAAFVKTFLRQTVLIFVFIMVGTFVSRQAKVLLVRYQKNRRPPSSPPSGNTEF